MLNMQLTVIELNYSKYSITATYGEPDSITITSFFHNQLQLRNWTQPWLQLSGKQF